MDVVTLGMLIIDEIHFEDDRPPAIDILGGAGSWAVIGARMFRASPASKRVGWTVHLGSDFPMKVHDEIQSWNTTCNIIDTPNRLTTRGWNGYGSQEKRGFKYTTEKFRVDHNQLTPLMLRARCFHLICTPKRCIDLVNGIHERRPRYATIEDDLPFFIWEPVPDSCGPEQLANVKRAFWHVDVVSPNHQELAALFSTESVDSDNVGSSVDVAEFSRKLFEGLPPDHGAVVVRCGERGCYVLSYGFKGYLPAYHQPNNGLQNKVVDPTGAGNAFLGGFCIGLLEATEGWSGFRTAAIYGSLAAGCAIEQIGLPTLTTQDGRELWNGVDMKSRWKAYNDVLLAHNLDPL